MPFFATGPNYIRAARWTGANEQYMAEEIGAHVIEALTFHDDGTLTITGTYLGDDVPVNTGQWVVSVAGQVVQVVDHETFQQQYPSELVGEPPFRFVIESVANGGGQ